MNVTAGALADALSAIAVDVRSGDSVCTGRLLSPDFVAAAALRIVAGRCPELPPLTPAEAAAILGISVSALCRRAEAGRVPHTRTPGGHRRYLETDIRALAQRKTGGT